MSGKRSANSRNLNHERTANKPSTERKTDQTLRVVKAKCAVGTERGA